MIDAKRTKETASILGFDLCGIASPDRFAGAPKGHHPLDIYPGCKSVIVYARQVPSESLFAANRVPYTIVTETLMREVDRLGLEFSLSLERLGVGAVMIPADDPYEHWDAERRYGRAILSLRHAGFLAGLGTLGKNSLLINRKFGNMIQMGAMLVDVEMEADPIADDDGCLPDCVRCLDACPQKALDGTTVDQKKCRAISIVKTEKGYTLKNCNACRRECPRLLGIGKEAEVARKQRSFKNPGRA